MRISLRAGAVVAGLAAALLSAPAAYATAPGDNGDVKIHKSSTDEFDHRNEPHVCSFYLDAFNFDGLQQVDWHIEAWAPTAHTKGETVKTGSLTLDTDGHGRTNDMTLPDGHYKLFWNFDGEKGAAKHKVFWTECESEGQGGGNTPSSSATPSSPSSNSPSASSPAAAGEGSSPSFAAGAADSPSAQGASGDLAETGNGLPVGLTSAAAVILLGAGGYLVMRRRKAQHD